MSVSPWACIGSHYNNATDHSQRGQNMVSWQYKVTGTQKPRVTPVDWVQQLCKAITQPIFWSLCKCRKLHQCTMSIHWPMYQWMSWVVDPHWNKHSSMYPTQKNCATALVHVCAHGYVFELGNVMEVEVRTFNEVSECVGPGGHWLRKKDFMLSWCGLEM